jgi:hypothetical protein
VRVCGAAFAAGLVGTTNATCCSAAAGLSAGSGVPPGSGIAAVLA